jgi:hypothetical protein
MASQGYYDWIKAGRPWTLAAPLVQLQRVLQGYGFTVYAYPDESHQKANLPEDHTSYSATGWPNTSPRWWAFAVDVMPKKSGGMLELASIAQQIIRDKDVGYPGTEWIKYINWTDSTGKTWQTSWKPNKATRTSSDTGHIHVSGRSDKTQATTPYDPIARLRGQGGRSDEDMGILAEGPKGELYFCIAGFSHPIVEGNIADIKYVASQGAYTLAKGAGNNAEWSHDGWVRKGWSEAVFGPVWEPTAVDVEIGQDVVIAALKSPGGQEAITSGSFAGAQRAETE